MYIEGVTSSNITSGTVDREDWFLFFFFFPTFFSRSLCLFSGDGDDRTWTRMESFLLAARDPLSRTMKGTPGKKECLPAQPTFP